MEEVILTPEQKQARLEYMRKRFPVLRKLRKAGETIADSVNGSVPKEIAYTEIASTLPTYQRFIEEERSERDIITSDEI